RRHRLRARRADLRPAGGHHRHLRQSAAAAGGRHAGVHADGRRAALETRRTVQAMSAASSRLEVLPRGVQVALALGVVALAAFPFFSGDFYVQMVARMMILAIFAMSLDLLQGVTGLVSLGHAAY